MPYSAKTFEPLIITFLELLKPKTFLDIGPGAGKYGEMVKQAAKSNNFECFATAVEYDDVYIEKFGLDNIYDRVLNLDARHLLSLEDPIAADICIIGDVLEHLPKSDGIDLLDYLAYKVKIILLVIPLNINQESWQGHSQEAHISNWYPHDFNSFPTVSHVQKKFGGTEFLLVAINGNQVEKKKVFKIYDQDHSILFGFPYGGLSELDVDLLYPTVHVERILLPNDLSNSAWIKRGNVQVESSDELAPDLISKSTKLIFKGKGEIFYYADGKNFFIYEPSFYLRRHSKDTGIIQLCNPVNDRKGLYEINLQSVDDGWQLLSQHSNSVKILSPFEGSKSKIGFHLRNITDKTIVFDIWNCSI